MLKHNITIIMEKMKVNIILMGNTKVGKSCLRRQCIQGNFTQSYIPTMVPDFLTKGLVISNKLVSMQIWDTPGEDKYKGLDKILYNNIDGCVLVYDLTNVESFRSLNNWMNEFKFYVRSTSEDLPVFVIANKLDMGFRREVSYEEAISWCKDNGVLKYFELSAQSKQNVTDAFEEIGKNIIAHLNKLVNEQELKKVIGDKQCLLHKGSIRSQYCITCDSLICINCQLNHKESKGHYVLSINDVALKTMRMLKESADEIATECILLDRGRRIEEVLTELSDRIMELKQEIKDEVCIMIDMIYEKEVESKLHQLSDQFEKVSQQYNDFDYDTYNLDKKLQEINTLLYTDYDYKKIIRLYKEINAKAGSDVQQILEMRVIREELVNLLKALEMMQVKFKYTIGSTLKSHLSEFGIDFQFTREKPFIGQKHKVDIRWSNGLTVYNGITESWVTFCSACQMPKYFKCRIKVHEDHDPNKGGRFIGVSTNKCDSTGVFYYASHNWWALSNNVGIWCKEEGSRGKGRITYGYAGDIVSVIYDRQNRLYFEVNGINTGQSFDNIEGPFYLACADKTKSQYEIIDVVAL